MRKGQPVALRLPSLIQRQHDRWSSQHTTSVENVSNVVMGACFSLDSRQFKTVKKKKKKDRQNIEAVLNNCVETRRIASRTLVSDIPPMT